MVAVADGAGKFNNQEEKNQSLVGIFEHEERGILLIKPSSNELALPGGTIRQSIANEDPQTHIQSEIAALRKLIYLQSGWILDIAGESRFCLYNDETARQQIKVFLLQQSTTPLIPQGWERDVSCKDHFVRPEIEVIDALANLQSRDKIILTDYLKNRSVTVRWPVCTVRNIA